MLVGDCHTPDGTDIRYRINRDNRSMIPQHSIRAGKGISWGEPYGISGYCTAELEYGLQAPMDRMCHGYFNSLRLYWNNGELFIVNRQATAEDVITLSQSFQSNISSHGGIILIPCVFAVGERKPRR